MYFSLGECSPSSGKPNPMNLNPAVQPPPRPAAGLRSTTSNCSADHPPGDNRFFRKQLRPKAGSRLTRRQPPVLGSREKRNSAPEGRPLLLGLILRALCVARPGAKTRGQQDGPSSVAPSSTSQSSRPCPHAGRRVSPLTEPSQLGISKAEMRFIFNKGTAKVSTTF